MLWTEFGRLGRPYYPWREIDTLQHEMDDLLANLRATRPADFPPVNIWNGGDEVVVTTEMPGIAPDKVEISVTGKVLTLKGSRAPEPLTEGEAFHRQERWYGSFTRSIELPFQIELEKIRAEFAKGVLTVTLPRAEAEKPRKIKVTTN